MESENRSFFSKVLKFIATRPISQLAISSILLGFGYGFLAKHFEPLTVYVQVIGFPGVIFMNCLKAIVLVFVLVIMTRTPMDMKELGEAKKFATMAISFYFISSLVASLLGLSLVHIIKPGKEDFFCSSRGTQVAIEDLETMTFLESLFKFGTLMFPANVLGAIVKDNILGVLVIFLTLGFYLARYSSTTGGKRMKSILDLLYQAVVDILYMVISLTPIGVFSLIAGEISKLDDSCVFAKLFVYILTFILANLVLTLVLYPLVFIIIVRQNPFKYSRHFISAIATAFSTASSAAALPLNLQASYEAGVDKNIANFVLPLGSTLNMNGSSIYYPVTIIFVSNMFNKPISIPSQLLLCIVSVIVTIGSAPVPSGALVYLILVSETVGLSLPQKAITLIWAIDPIMDRILTSTNVWGDTYAVKFIEVFYGWMFKSGEKDIEAINVAENADEPSRDDEIQPKKDENNSRRSSVSNSALSRARRRLEKSVVKMEKSGKL